MAFYSERILLPIKKKKKKKKRYEVSGSTLQKFKNLLEGGILRKLSLSNRSSELQKQRSILRNPRHK